MKKILALTITALLLTACNTSNELQNPQTPEEKPQEITYEIRMHSPAEFFGGDKDWYIASNMPSSLTDTLAQWDAALFQIEGDEETLLAASIIEITPELKENHALLPFASASGKKAVVNSVLPETDNPNSTLFVYNPQTKKFESFSEEINRLGQQLSPAKTKVAFVQVNEGPATDFIQIFDLENATMLQNLELQPEEMLTKDLLGMESYLQLDLKWLDENTIQYFTYDATGTKSTAKTIEL